MTVNVDKFLDGDKRNILPKDIKLNRNPSLNRFKKLPDDEYECTSCGESGQGILITNATVECMTCGNVSLKGD